LSPLTTFFAMFLALLGTGVPGAETCVPHEGAKLPSIPLTGMLHIKISTRIAPGSYTMAAEAGKGVIEIDADNVVLDLTGVTLSGHAAHPWDREGWGIHAANHSHLTIRGGTIRGYRFGIFIQGGEDIKVIASDVSGNRAQKLISTESKYDEGDWVDIFHLDAWKSYGAGLYLKDVLGAQLESIQAHKGQNGIMLSGVTHATLHQCDVSHNSGWGIALFRSTWNDLLDNHADWNVRCEGRNYSAGCDSAGILLIDGSSHNRIVGNSFTHSGDGYFVSKPETGAPSDYNYVAFNDGSYSPHNAFESTFTSHDEFYHNTADHSDYGFWMGFSRDTSVTDNHVEGSKRDGIAIEHGSGNIIVRNQILKNGTAGIRLFRRQAVPDPSRDYSILQNEISGSPVGILLDQTFDATIAGNTFTGNGVGVRVQNGSARVALRANRFSPAGATTVEANPLGALQQ
jgi:parallel beta-helix repeat protein